MSINSIENQSSVESRYRPEIDGLRAFAVVAVIINHFNKEILPNGYLGVDIFFVISGFVITASLYQRPSKNFKDFISGFYERRIKRLVPALSVFVLIMSITICLFNPKPEVSLKTGMFSLFGLSNLYLFKTSTNYFAQSTELNVFTHTWSLGVEEQFYLLFPFLIWSSGFGRQTKNGNRNLLLIVGSLAIISLIGFIYLYPINQSAGYFLMPSRFWEMALGCLLFIALQKIKSIGKFLEKTPPIVVLALMIGIMYLPTTQARAATLAIVPLTLILITSLKKGTIAFKIFTHPKVVYIGLISYSLYLWHWGVLSISRWTIGINLWTVTFQVILIFVLAITSYRYVETPLRRGSWFGKRWKTLTVSIGVLLALFGGLATLVGGGVLLTLSRGLIVLGKPLSEKLYTGKEISSTRPKLQKGEKCLQNLSNETNCYLINNNSKKTLWILGDSHAEAIYSAGEKVANYHSANLKLYSASGTPFPSVGHYRKERRNLDLQALDDFRLLEKELYRQLKTGDIILLSMRMPYHFGGTYYEYPSSDFIFIKKDGSLGSQENYFNQWISSVVNLANIAKRKDSKVIIQTPIPEWEKEAYNLCATRKTQWFNVLRMRNCQIPTKFFIDKEEGLYKHLFKKLNRLASSHENIYLFDTYKVICPESICSFTRDGVDIYRDDDHINSAWAKDELAPEIYKFINEIQTMDK